MADFPLGSIDTKQFLSAKGRHAPNGLTGDQALQDRKEMERVRNEMTAGVYPIPDTGPE